MQRRDMLIAGGSAVLCGLLAGCAGSPPAQYYRITAEPGPTDPAVHGNIVLRPVILPGYLGQTGVPKPSGRQGYATFDNDLWAGSLSGLLAASMVQNLAQRLPEAVVIGGGGAIDLPDATIIEINVLNFAPGPDGRVALSADISVKPAGKEALRRTGYVQLASIDGGISAGAVVTAMAQVWATLADRIGATYLASV